MFCDTCHKNIHQQGRLNSHLWNPLIPQCVQCKDRAATVRCFVCRPRLPFCRGCFSSSHQDCPEPDNLPPNTVKMRARAGELRQQEKKKQEAEEEKIRAANQLLVVQGIAAVKLQRVWRGSLCRKKVIQPLLEEREQRKQRWVEMMAKQNEDAKAVNRLKRNARETADRAKIARATILAGPTLEGQNKRSGLAGFIGKHLVQAPALPLPGFVSIEAQSNVCYFALEVAIF